MHYLSQPIFSLFSHLNSAIHNLVIELCSALIFIIFKRLFSKFAHIFVAIGLLNYSKIQIYIILLKRAFSIGALKKSVPHQD